MLEIDLAFPHSYEIEELPELPGTGSFDVPLLYFPPPKTRPEHDGLWLKIRAWPLMAVMASLGEAPASALRKSL
jgi:hypothetical protein